MPRTTDYDSISSEYDRRYRGQEYAETEQALAAFIGEGHNIDVLEVGCGTGHWLKVLAGRSGFLAGFDLSANMLQRAHELVPEAPLVRGRAETLPYRAQSFDRVFCINAFHHFTDKPAFLAEAYRVLRPGGGLMSVGLDPHAGLDRWWVYDYFHETLDLDTQRYPSAATLRADMAGAGFSRCETSVAEHFVTQMPAHAARERGLLDRSYTSQLTILSTQEHQAGLDRIAQAMAAEQAQGAVLMLLADLRLYATVGWRDG
ncbi:MAG: class I SAM-dependent methyltransferase [Deltaproteobacteria bacterium]|nr:class I SAM-dependent methyltransferase [Deltaproteobacteria bacterium]